jgi:hypothetical protein
VTSPTKPCVKLKYKEYRELLEQLRMLPKHNLDPIKKLVWHINYQEQKIKELEEEISQFKQVDMFKPKKNYCTPIVEHPKGCTTGEMFYGWFKMDTLPDAAFKYMSIRNTNLETLRSKANEYARATNQSEV